mmetsp:Transcript_44226/g.102159  ORF Transcript_44226/g.102159 Transcript_44226/m.102159 type:complete len:107 (-) Transcript_44226:95-415(-)
MSWLLGLIIGGPMWMNGIAVMASVFRGEKPDIHAGAEVYEQFFKSIFIDLSAHIKQLCTGLLKDIFIDGILRQILIDGIVREAAAWWHSQSSTDSFLHCKVSWLYF